MSRAGRRRAGLLIPLFSCPSTAAGASATSATSRRSPPGWPAPGQRCCSCCRSTRWRRASSRRIRRSARWRSTRSSSASPPCRNSPRSAAKRRSARRSRARCAAVRRAPRIEYHDVRRLKQRALRRGVRALPRDASGGATAARARDLQRFSASRRGGSRTTRSSARIHAREDERPWTEWPEALQRREPAAIDRARRELAREVLFQQYLQWLAGAQWQDARAPRARRRAVRRSAVHGRRRQRRRLGAAASVPARRVGRRAARRLQRDRPGLGHAGLPVGRDRRGGFPLAARARAAQRRSFDGYRVDHLVGFYRTYGRPRDGGEPFFTPAGEREQTALGERVLELFREPGAEIIAEDLGTVPDFVRASLARLGVPGFRVLPLGAALARARASRSAIRRTTRRCRSRRRARTTPSRSIVWWERRRRTSGEQIERAADRAAAHRRRRSARRAVRRRRSATCCSRALFACRIGPAAAAGAGRRSAGAIASTSRPPSRDATGRSGCRGRAIGWTRSPRRASGRQLRAWARANVTRPRVPRTLQLASAACSVATLCRARPRRCGFGSGLRGSFSSRFAVLIHERRDDDRVAHHVVGLDPLVDVHGSSGACASRTRMDPG